MPICGKCFILDMFKLMEKSERKFYFNKFSPKGFNFAFTKCVNFQIWCFIAAKGCELF